MSIKTDFDNYERGYFSPGPKSNNLHGAESLIEELLQEDFTGAESPFIDWEPEKVRDLAEIEDVMVKQYIATQKVRYRNPSRIVKGTLNDPVFSSAENLKTFLDSGIVRKYKIFKFNCEFCDFGINKKCFYLTHLDTHLKMLTKSGLIQDTQPVECVQCKKIYPSEYRYKNHVRNFHSVGKIECDDCGLKISKRLFKRHLLTHNDYTESCKICERKFKTQNRLRIHINRVHGDENWKCHLCPFKGKLNKKLQLHLKTVHNKQSKESCENCGKCYSANHLKVHKLYCNNTTFKPRSYPTKKCHICEKLVTKLPEHIRDVHEQLKETCDICGKVVAQRSILKHKEVHNKIECTACGKYFTETFLRLIHRTRCKKSDKFADEKVTVKCEICGKLVDRRSIRSHKEIHNKVECTECGEYFTDSYLRLRHPKRCKKTKK